MAVTEEPSIKGEQEEKPTPEDTEKLSESKKEEYDVVKALEATGHSTCVYPNGLVLGIHIEGIPGKRGVHVESVYVLDLRRASFGKATLAMQAAVLETLNRDMESVLQDVDIPQSLIHVSKFTPRGKIQIPMLKANPNHAGSMIHYTRTVYVITNPESPPLDLSWLTESSRILYADDFLLARRSDMRAFLSEMQNRVLLEKYQALGSSIRNGWFGILSLIFAVIGGISLLSAAMLVEDTSLLPFAAIVLGSLLGIWLIRLSEKNLAEYNEIVEAEYLKVNKVGDGHRIDASISSNEERLKLQKDLSFVISPLLASAAGSIGIGDYESAVVSSCMVLDECVRFSKNSVSEKGDDGLAKFLSLFSTLGLEIDEDELSVAYVGLTNHMASPLSEDEVLKHCTSLSNTLYNVGILRPSVKDRIDDMMNQRALKENLRHLREESMKPEQTNLDSESETSDDAEEFLIDTMESDAKESEEIPEIDAVTHPDEIEKKDDATAEQLNELSEMTRAETGSDVLEQTASDVVNKVRSGTNKEQMENVEEDELEDDITAH